jgi:YHS domain-containing protein
MKPAEIYKIFLDEIAEAPWSTPEHREYVGGKHAYLCSKKCYESYKWNMKAFWHPDGEY